MMTTTLAPGDKGTIKCAVCKQEFAAFYRGRGGRGRTGWSVLREHVERRHAETKIALARGLAEFDRQNELIQAEGRALCAPARRDWGQA